MPTEKTAPQTPTLPESDAVQPQDLNPLLDVMSHEFRYAMVPLDAIFVDGEKPDEASVTALADDVLHTGLRHPICIILNDIDAVILRSIRSSQGERAMPPFSNSAGR
jgi:hypothetical protein